MNSSSPTPIQRLIEETRQAEKRMEMRREAARKKQQLELAVKKSILTKEPTRH